MKNSSANTTTTTAAESSAEGTFGSVLTKAGELWDETRVATGKATQTLTGKVNETLGEGNFDEAVDDTANRLGETTSVLGDKASTLRTALQDKAGTAVEQAEGFFSGNLDHLINFTKGLFGG